VLLTWLSLAASLATLCAGCVPEEPVRIGFVGGLSGGWADLGMAGRDAAQLAVDQRNQAGGIGGRPVELLIRDDRQDPESAERATRDLIARGSVAIVGPMTSSMAAAVVPIATRAAVLVMGPTVTSEALSGRDDQFFRVTATTRTFAARNARHQLDRGGMRRVAAAYDLANRVYTEDWLARFRQVFTEGGGEVLTPIPFLMDGQHTYQDLARRLLAVRPDGILIVANSMDSAMLCQQLRKLDARVPVTLSDWGATERLIEMGGKAVEGVTVVQTFNRGSREPRYLAFRRAFLERYRREPGSAGTYGYEAAHVVLDALERREGDQPLKKVLLAMGRIEGLQGGFGFDAYGDVARQIVSISVIRNGEFVVID
jgi:branched-chain amino acid transport system substrate-binding protein